MFALALISLSRIFWAPATTREATSSLKPSLALLALCSISASAEIFIFFASSEACSFASSTIWSALLFACAIREEASVFAPSRIVSDSLLASSSFLCDWLAASKPSEISFPK